MAQTFATVVGLVILAALIQGGTINDPLTLPEEVAQSLHKLEIDVNKTLDKVQKFLSKSTIEVDRAANAAQKKAVSLMQNSENKFRNELDELKKKAAAAGVNIDDCLKGDEETLVNLPNVFTDQLIHCFSNIVKEGIKQLQDVLSQLQKLIGDEESIQRDFEKCKQEKYSNKCLFKVAFEIKKENEVLIKIEKDAATAILFIEKLPVKIETCATTKVAEYESELKTLTEKITTCIIKKLHK